MSACQRHQAHTSFCLIRCSETPGCIQPQGHRSPCSATRFNGIDWADQQHPACGLPIETRQDSLDRLRTARDQAWSDLHQPPFGAWKVAVYQQADSEYLNACLMAHVGYSAVTSQPSGGAR